MRYSLLSRFRGALLGAALGDLLGCRCSGRTKLELQKMWPERGRGGANPPRSQTGDWGRLAVANAQNLIQYGRADGEKAIPQVGSKNGEAAGIAIATLPLALFFHEDEARLRIGLQQAIQGWESTPVSTEGAMAVGYAIAQCLKEKLNPSTLLSQIAAYLQDNEPATSASKDAFLQQLAQVQTALETGASLEMTASLLGRSQEDSLSNTHIALAFYCFLGTLEDLSLSVMRAARTGKEPPLAAAIAGALSGAYNSTAGIPLAWLVPSIQSHSTELWGTHSASEILHLGSRLFSAWCGAYDTAELPISPTDFRAVAAPQVIRPR